MATGGWVAELDKKEHKNWVKIGCALNIAKSGITTKIQKEMEAWYQSLISSPPLQSLPSCACAPLSLKCPTCVTWKAEMKRHHTSGRPKICWDNSDSKQWGSPTGAWEVAKLFMPILGSRTTDVVNAETTDIGGLLNLLEWCPFINPPVSRTALISARDECRNHWAHAPKQEIQDADLLTIFGHLNKLLTDPVFSSDRAAQQSSKDLQDLFHKGLVNVRESEIEALHLLRQSLVADVTKWRDDVFDVQRDVLILDAKMKTFEVDKQKDLFDVKKEEDLHREEICKLAQDLDKLKDVMAHHSKDLSTVMVAVDDFNRLLNKRDDLKEVFKAIQDDVEVVKTELNVTQSKVATIETNQTSLKHKVNELQKELSILQTKVMEVLEKGQATAEQNEGDDDIMCTAPSRLPSFTGRKSALEWLGKSLVLESAENSPGTSCCTKTICGLGGCGKTSLAVEFAWSYKSCFPGGLFWINGENDENISMSVAEILSLKDIPTSKNDSIDDTLNTFLTWLSKKELPWLLVMDNVDELQDPMCPTGVKKICKGPWQRTGKSLKHGHILLTTRRNARDARAFLKHSLDDFLELSCFSVEDGALFLMKRTGVKLNGEWLDPDAICLAKELGELPLALEQAAAYITASPIPLNFAEYLEKFKEVRVRLLKHQPVTALSVEAQHRLSVHTTWELNFEYVKEQSPAAATMMRIAAFLNSEKVPIDVINPGLPELDQEELRERARIKVDIASILRVLSSYSLYSVDHQSKVFSVHKLVQEVVRDSLKSSQKVEALVAATRIVRFALVKNSDLSLLKEEERNIIIALVLNVQKLRKHMVDEIHSTKGKVTHLLYNRNTYYLCSLAHSLLSSNIFLNRLDAEICHFKLEVAKMCDNLDPNDILRTMFQRSLSLRNCATASTYQQAKKEAEQTVQKLAEMEKSGIVIEPDTKYLVLEHMASYYAIGNEWEKNYKALLQLEDLLLSEENVVELQILIARAENFVSTGNFQCALERYEKALKLARRVYTPDHNELLRVLQFITCHLQQEGKLHEARKYAEEMLQIAKKQPPTSDFYLRGMTDALNIMCHVDPQDAEDALLRILEDRWPVIYKSILTGVASGHMDTDETVVDEPSSYVYVARVLQGLINCFFISNSSVKQKESKSPKHKRNLYRSVATMLISIQKKRYGQSHLEVKAAYQCLVQILRLLGIDDEASRLEEQLKHTYEEPVSNQYCSTIRNDVNVLHARQLKNTANKFFKTQNYSKALEIYQMAINRFPNDSKLLTDRAMTYVKLSEEQASRKYHTTVAVEDQKRLLQYALQDAVKAITADPSWVEGYYWKAVCLAKLGQRGPSLSAAAVAEHLFPSQCTQIPAVVEIFGCYKVEKTVTVEDLQNAVKTSENGLVILVLDGRYELTEPLKIPANVVVVGLSKVQITCKKDVPLLLNKTVYIDNIELTPSMESLTTFKEDAKKCVNHGHFDQALSLYSEALLLCPENSQLLTARALTYMKSAEGKNKMTERESLLGLALKDCQSSIRADPSWLLSYSTKTAGLVELGRKNEALASAALFNHLSSGRDIPSVIQRYGALKIHVVERSDELNCVLQGITEPGGVNQIVLIKEGEYLLEKTVEVKQPIVVVGLGKVTVSCKNGAPFQFSQEHFVEGVELYGGCGDEPESKGPTSSTDDVAQEEVISFALPSGYENSDVNSECKVN